MQPLFSDKILIHESVEVCLTPTSKPKVAETEPTDSTIERPEIIQMGKDDPFQDTDLVIIREDFPGVLKPNEIRLSDYLRMNKLYEAIIIGDIIKITASQKEPSFEGKIQAGFRKLLSRSIGREFFEVFFLMAKGKIVFIRRAIDEDRLIKLVKFGMSVPDDSLDSMVQYDGEREFLIQLNTEFLTLCTTTDPDGSQYCFELPLFISIMHEFIHCYHILQSNPDSSEMRLVYTSPQGEVGFHNAEEELTIEKDPKFSEHKFCEIFGIPIRHNHNAFRFKSSDLTTMDDVKKEVYFLSFCRAGDVSLLSKNWDLFSYKPEDTFEVKNHDKKVTAFELAVYSGYMGMIQFLRNKGVESSYYKSDPLKAIQVISMAICSNKIPVLEYVLTEFDLKIVDYKSKCSFLIYAILKLKGQCLPMVKYLLDHGDNLDPINGITPLDQSAYMVGTEVFDFFYSKGLRPTLYTFKYSLLHRNMPLLQKFDITPEYLYNPYYLDCENCSSMHIAASSGETDIIELLHKLDTDFKANSKQQYALHLKENADKKLPIENAIAELKLPAFKLLLTYFEDLITNIDLHKRLFTAIMHRNSEDRSSIRIKMLRHLRSLGINVPFDILPKYFDFISLSSDINAELEQMFNKTPIEECRLEGILLFDWGINNVNCGVISYCISRGKSLNEADVKGNTLLHQAIINNELMRFFNLVCFRADLQIKNLDGFTPLQLAEELYSKSEVNKYEQIKFMVEDPVYFF